MNSSLLINQLVEILQSGSLRSYTFRTRLERTLLRLVLYIENGEIKGHTEELLSLCKSIRTKIDYISDKSNQNSEGELNSFSYFKQDLKKIHDILNSENITFSNDGHKLIRIQID